MNKMTTALMPESDRCPGLSVQEAILRDGDPGPALASIISDEVAPNLPIPAERYTSQAYYDLEMERLWPKVWQMACREEHVAEPGDHYVYDIGPYSFVVLRTDSGDVKAYYNSCLHRGTKLKPAGAVGYSPDLRCPYHGWAWTLDGAMKALPCKWDFQHVDPETMKLPEVKVALWGGFVYINMDENAIPFEEYAGVLPDHLERFGMEDTYVSYHFQKEVRCNWKIASEAFLESYHFADTHPQILPVAGDINAQYDLFGDHVSRYYGLMGIPSPNCDREYSETEVLGMMIAVGGAERREVPEGSTARRELAASVRAKMSDASGKDYSSLSTSEVVDAIYYFLFPNQHSSVSLSMRNILRMRPLSVDRCLFEVMTLDPVPSTGRPPPAEMVYVGADECIRNAPGADPSTVVFDQDMSNLEAQQLGLAASKSKLEVTASTQEKRIRHAHNTMAKYMEL